MDAVLAFRAFVTGTDVPIDDVSDVESDDGMQQIARRTAGLKIWVKWFIVPFFYLIN